MAEAAFRSVLAIERAETASDVQREVRAFARPLGYDRFVLFSASAAQDDVIERIYWVEGDWFGDGAAIDAETYMRRCPVTHHILQAREPFFWTKTDGDNGEFYEIVRMPRGRGLHGLQVPVFGPSGLEGAMSLGGEAVDASPQARLALTCLARAAFGAARRLMDGAGDEPVGSLSDREREVLALTAAGRRQGEIAAILRLSERTVENHLRRIRKRLGVATTAQAVRIAIRNSEIAI